jgi:acyl carrier protein
MHPAICDAVTRYITDNYLYTRPDHQLARTDPLLGSGIIDSMGVIELVEFIQTEFGISIDDGDITEANFGTVADIAAFVARKRASAEAA